MTARLADIHHVSALSARIGESHRFYTRVLGLRPLITTVNQDDTSMYHLFFGDGAGTPGSDMPVFDMPRAALERHGNNCVSRTTFRVAGISTLEFWAERLVRHGSAVGEIATDGPGFDVDGPIDARRLSLPPALEPRRAEIEAGLEPLAVIESLGS